MVNYTLTSTTNLLQIRVIILAFVLLFTIINLILTIHELHVHFSSGEHLGRILGESGPEEEEGAGGVVSRVTPEEYNELLKELDNFEMIIEKGRYLYNEEKQV